MGIFAQAGKGTRNENGRQNAARPVFVSRLPDQSLSVTTVVVAPEGSLVITGSEPPESSDFTVRS